MKVRLIICTYTPRHKSISLLFARVFNSYQKEDITASFLSLIEFQVSIAKYYHDKADSTLTYNNVFSEVVIEGNCTNNNGLPALHCLYMPMVIFVANKTWVSRWDRYYKQLMFKERREYCLLPPITIYCVTMTCYDWVSQFREMDCHKATQNECDWIEGKVHRKKKVKKKVSSVSQISWSYCSFSAFISELMLYFILRVLSIRSDPFQELSNLPGFVTPLHHAPGIRHHLETKSTSVQRKSGWPTLDGWVVESLKRNLFACRRCICNSSNLVIGS